MASSSADGLIRQLREMGVDDADAVVAVQLGARNVAEAFNLITARAEQQSAKDWEEYFSATYGGRPYFSNKKTGETTWDEPDCYRKENEAIDAELFHMAPEAVRSVMSRLRLMQKNSETWPEAREMLAKILGNIASRPADPKVRSIKKASEKFQKALWSVAHGADLLGLIGFRDAGETVTLPEAADTAPLRLALAHVERSQKLTQDIDTGRGKGKVPRTPAEAGAYRWQQEVHYCGRCDELIHDGSERTWTGAFDAPIGQFRYACEACADYSLCEKCMDLRTNGDTTHPRDHTFETVPPVTSRYDKKRNGTGPWGNFSVGISARSRERLKERTGM